LGHGSDERRAASIGLICLILGVNACSLQTGAFVSGSPDAGGIPVVMCPPGFLDANHDPRDGCEYECIPTSPSTELCDGYDNDCNLDTADGADDPSVGVACDGLDDDPCEEGTFRCDAGRLVCEDFTDNSRESCNGIDDDCDSFIDEEATDFQPYYADRDGDGASTMDACGIVDGFVGRLGDCDDLDGTVSPDGTETCNGRDDDCDLLIDETVDCDCVTEPHAGHEYRFCRGPVSWQSARDTCAGAGSALATIDDDAENTWVNERVRFHGRAPAWVGLNDRSREGSWVWEAGGSLGGYQPWQTGEPNNGGSCWGCEENCGILAFFAGLDTWNDLRCDSNNAFVCERAP
jgi:hypothetical protein